MAVLDALPGVEVHVRVDGQNLEEYDNDDDEIQEDLEHGSVAEYQASRTISKYVMSSTGKEFTIHCTKQRPYVQDCPYLGFETFIDGKYVNSPLLAPRRTKDEVKGFESTSNGRTVVRSFKFSKIEISEDDNDAKIAKLKEDSKRMSSVGEIMVKIYRWSGDESIPMMNSQKYIEPISTKVHEKVLKGDAKSHGTTFGKPLPASSRNVLMGAKKIDGNDYPLAIFKLKYRSKEALKALLVIDNTPEPEELLEDSPAVLDGLTDAQRAEVEEFARLLRNKKNTSGGRIKRERADADSRTGPSKRSRKSSEKVTIDLTGDDDESNDDEIVALN